MLYLWTLNYAQNKQQLIPRTALLTGLSVFYEVVTKFLHLIQMDCRLKTGNKPLI